MQRFFTGLLCFSVLLLHCSFAAVMGDSSVWAQTPSTQTETKAAAPTPGTRPPGPAVAVAESTFDFGVMREDKDYSHTFIIKNEGTSELIIEKVQHG
jgi:hypothetical protein